MFEDQTFDVIMERMLEQVDSELDKREGSIIYDALAPAAAEIRTLYLSLDALLTEFNITTATEGYLKQYGEDFSIEPNAATSAVIIGEFTPSGADVSNKTFSIDGINYIAADSPLQLTFDVDDDGDTGSVRYSLTALTAGSVGNVSTGTLIPIDEIAGLQSAKVVELSVAGEDEEDTESFRERLLDRIKNNAFGGNVAYYEQVVSEIDGVGCVKILPCTTIVDSISGPARKTKAGYVTVELLNNKYTAPSSELIATVKKTLVGDGANGSGYGLAPIGHYVYVVSPELAKVKLQIYTFFTAEDQTGGDYSDEEREEITNTVTAALDEYFATIRQAWKDGAAKFQATVSTLRLISAIMSVDVIDEIWKLAISIDDGETYSEIYSRYNTDAMILDTVTDTYALPVLSEVEIKFGEYPS